MGSDIVRRQSKLLKIINPKELLRAVTKVVGNAGIQEVHKGESLLIFPLFRYEIPPYSELGPFQRIRIVTAAYSFPADGSSRRPFLDALLRHGSDRARMYVQTDGAESTSAVGTDLVLMAGWETLNRSGGPLAVPNTAPMCGVYHGIDSPGANDLAYRRDLFERVAAAMGCSDVLRFEVIDGALITTAADGWRVMFDRAEPSGRNARGFFLFGFPNVGEAVDAGERVLRNVFRRIDESLFLAVTSEETDYESLRAPLTALAKGWQVEVLGNLKQTAATILSGALPKDEPPPNRLPVFKYRSHSNQIFGELVAVDGGYALELSSLDATPQQLEACIEVVEGRAPKKKSTTKSQGSDRSAPRSAGQASQAKRGKAAEGRTGST